ncbi:hypothetical protein DFS34DRAFT_72610 [Phlyctochytrium arcticum]|nr:hypothetical protein DFS34DRAFT_72610 [Phlyctochytrium arcticum]
MSLQESTSTTGKGPPAPWYLQLRGLHLDIIGDFAGTELFVVDGDALFWGILAAVERNDPGSSPQLLHCVYAVESFLQKLVNAKANFELAFFKDREMQTCISPRLDETKKIQCRRLLRAIVIDHLERNSKVVVNVFDSVYGQDWARYVDTKKPYFIMTDDGTAVVETGASDVELGILDARRNAMLECMWMFLHQGLTVALLSEDLFRDAKVVGFVFHTTSTITASGELKSHHDGFLTAAQKLNAAVPVEAPPADGAKDTPLAITALGDMIKSLDGVQKDLAKIFLLHLHSLSKLPLEVRARPTVSLPVLPAYDATFDNFMTRFYAAAANRAPNASKDEDCIDMMDERLFKSMLCDIMVALYQKKDAKEFVGALPGITEAEQSWSELAPGTPFWEVQQLAKAVDGESVQACETLATTRTEPTHILPLLPYEQPHVLAYLPELPTLSSDQDSGITDNFDPQNIPNYETSHWHVSKPLAPVKKPAATTVAKPFAGRPVNPKKIAGRARKAEQRQAGFIQKYASSLTGAHGRIMKPKTVVVQPKGHQQSASRAQSAATASVADGETPAHGKGKGKAGGGGGKKGASASKADVIRASNAARLLQAEHEAARKRWAIVRDKIEKIGYVGPQIAELERIISEEKSSAANALTEERNLFLVMILLQKWAPFCMESQEMEATADKKEEGMPVLVQIFQLCQSIIKSPVATKATVEEARRVLKTLGLDSPEEEGDKASSSRAVSAKSSKKDKDKDKSSSKKSSKKEKEEATPEAAPEDVPLSFKFKYPRHPSNISWLRCPHTLTTFQLLYCGPHMDRTMGSAPDPRVDFQPDAWQREVLDTIDQDESVFVVAPTSAGKTFIAFYAIEKVLRESDDGIVVYVAPTKALVNQIAAEISARFSKSYKHAGVTVWAVHTRDYRIHEPLKCQVLITVPHILQILMLQPDVSADWTPRLKRIIFDEIHSISSMEGGLIWEQNLVLAPCPIVALSATVGNPDEFGQWLKDVQAAKGHRLEIIRHAHRYSDLRKFIYVPVTYKKFVSLDEKLGDKSTALTHLHPAAALALGATSIPDDLYLEPFECVQLYEAMFFEQDGQAAVLPKSLEPEKYFSARGVIKKSDVIAYQSELKACLQTWMDLPDARTTGPFRRVLDRLTGELRSSMTTSVNKWMAEHSGHQPTGIEYALENVMALCLDLHQQKKLPAILFNYDRGHVEAIAMRILEELEAAEEAFKTSSSSWAYKIKQWEAWKVAEVARRAAAAKTARAAAKDDDNDGGGDDGDSGWEATFDPTAPLPQFSFAGLKTHMSNDEIAHEIESLEKWGKVSPKLCAALRRGVGVHHAGMNLRYRQVVERWFRAGLLRVVVATGTLALGINMPATTSVFTEDSVFLTALEFRQAAGRAGRRGFDLLGHVVFFGLPLDKVYRLLASRLPDLRGHFPLSTTLVLRLHQLLVDPKSAPVAKDMVTGLLSLGNMAVGNTAAKTEVLHHLRFSIEYLRRAGLLGVDGQPTNLAGLVSHLYWTEPMNLCFAVLMNSGVLREIANGPDAKITMLTTLAHLFGRRKRPAATMAFKADLLKRSPSKVFLEPLPPRVVKVLEEHNALVFQVMESYVHHYVKTLPYEDVAQLPFSGRTFPKSKASADASSPLLSNLASTSLPYTARSPFVALSGLDDTFASVQDMARTLRSGFTLQSTVVPSVSELLDSTTVLDAYVVDFYRHGQFKALDAGNGILPGDVWQLINDFMLVLAALRTSLEVLLTAYAKTRRQLDQIEEAEADELNGDEQEEEDEDEEEELEGTPRWSPPIKLKAKVRDDRLWDVYVLLCEIQKEYGEKLDVMNA